MRSIQSKISSCYRKIKYDTKDDCLKVMRCINRKERKYHKLEAYKCSICNNWHFGHKIKN